MSSNYTYYEIQIQQEFSQFTNRHSLDSETSLICPLRHFQENYFPVFLRVI